jgi:DNA polymerase-3 subunit epsilon
MTIIDLAIQRIAFDARGRIVRLGRLRQWFEGPGVPIPPEIVALTGISDADVRGQRIQDSEAVAMISASDLTNAHNAAFDAPRVKRRLPAAAGSAWACSCAEIDWPALGFDGQKLGHLLMQCCMFHEGHRAGSDI